MERIFKTKMKKKDDTNRLYNEIYRNAAMGAGTTKHLLSSKRGEKMTECLQKQHAEYTAVCRNAENALKDRGEKIKGLSKAAKMRTDAAVSLNLLLGRSDSHVAQMMVTGSTMGVVNAEKKLTKYENAEASAKALMQHLSDFELSTVEKMKPFL